MIKQQQEFLTVHELAELLRIKERKVYALVANGEIACNKAMGKLLFPRASVEAWLARHHTGTPLAAPRHERPCVFAGSHDPLLDWALRESRSGIASFFDGSMDGLQRLSKGEAIAGGIHLLDAKSRQWNRPHVEQIVGGEPIVLLEWGWRQRGLVVAAGNPHRIEKLSDLASLRIVPRQTEAGSQMLFELLLNEQALDPEELQFIAPAARTETDLAIAIADDKADAGFGLASLAAQFKLDFVAVIKERYDIVVYRRDYFEEPFQCFMQFCRSPNFTAKAKDLGGYDLQGFGTVHFNGP